MITEKTYTLASTAWPRGVWNPEGRNIQDELAIQIQTDEDWYGEMFIEWVILQGKPVPRLRAFSDSWSALAVIDDVLGGFNGEDPGPDEIIEALEGAGFVPSEYHGQASDVSDLSVRSLRSLALRGDTAAIYELSKRAAK